MLGQHKDEKEDGALRGEEEQDEDGRGRLSPTVSHEHHPVDSVLYLATDIELRFCNDSDRSICNTYDDTAVPSTSALFNTPWTDKSTEVPVFDITKTPEECSTPQLKTKTRCIIPKKDLIPSSEQMVRDEAEVRCRRNRNLIIYDEEIHVVRLETARAQRETALEQVKGAHLQNELLELQIKKAKAELEKALANK